MSIKIDLRNSLGENLELRVSSSLKVSIETGHHIRIDFQNHAITAKPGTWLKAFNDGLTLTKVKNYLNSEDFTNSSVAEIRNELVTLLRA